MCLPLLVKLTVNSRWQAHVFQRLAKLRVRPQTVQSGIDFELDDLGVPLVECLLKPFERLNFLAEGDMDHRDQERETERLRESPFRFPSDRPAKLFLLFS